MSLTIKMTGLHCKQIGQVIYDKAVSPFDRKSYQNKIWAPDLWF